MCHVYRSFLGGRLNRSPERSERGSGGFPPRKMAHTKVRTYEQCYNTQSKNTSLHIFFPRHASIKINSANAGHLAKILPEMNLIGLKPELRIQTPERSDPPGEGGGGGKLADEGHGRPTITR